MLYLFKEVRAVFSNKDVAMSHNKNTSRTLLLSVRGVRLLLLTLDATLLLDKR